MKYIWSWGGGVRQNTTVSYPIYYADDDVFRPLWAIFRSQNVWSYICLLGNREICHHISFMELGHLLTRSCLTYREVSSKVYNDSFCQLGSSVSLPWVFYFEAFYLHVVSSFSFIQVTCPKLVLVLTLCNLCICFVICPSVSCCSSHVFHLWCCYSSGVTCFNSPSFVAI